MNLAKKGTIISVKTIAKKTIEVAIKVPDDFNFVAGQYIWLMIPELKYPDAKGNTRMWSIASSPNRKGELDIIFRTSLSGYKKTLIEMVPGSEIIFSGPFGQMRLPEDNSRPIVFLAGGVGIAPFLSMIRFSSETRSNHKITLLWANDSEEETPYLNELERLEKENNRFKLIKTLGRFEGESSRVLINENIGSKTIWYVTGLQGFVNSAGKFLNNAGVLPANIFFEQFYPETAAGTNFKEGLKIANISAYRYPFFTAIENALFHVIITDSNGHILYANRGAQNLTGYSFEEMKGNTPRLWGGLMPGSFYKELWETKKYLRQTFIGEVQNRRKNQDVYYVQIHTSPILDENQELVGFITSEQDITKLKELDIATNENKNPRRLLWAFSATIFGVEFAIMFALHYLFFLPLSFTISLIDSSILVVMTYPILYFYSFKPLVAEINRRQAGEKLLELSESHYRNIFEFSLDGILLLDLQAQIIMSNSAAQKLLGYTANELIGMHMRKTYPPEDIPEFERRFKDFQIKRELRFERKLIRGDGTLIFVDIFVSQTPDERALMLIRDITERKKIEQKLYAADRAKSEFISIASHQLRTPISGLSWLIESLSVDSKNFNSKQKRYVKDLESSSKRLIGLIEDLLNFSKIQLGTSPVMDKEKVGIHDFIKESIKDMASYADFKKHTITLNDSIQELLTVDSNKKSLYNVLQNLISNAVDYSPEHTVVTINLEKTGDFIKISISNEGPAISKEEQASIFSRFFRGENAKKTKPEGTGLGLYIVKTFIEDMGGKVGFESEEGKDTTFWFTIPLNKNGNR